MINGTMLDTPCSYQGGKKRISNQIVNQIYDRCHIDDNTIIYDLCCGGGAVTLEFINRGIKPTNIVMCDVSSWGMFWKSIGNGSFDVDRFHQIAEQVPRDKSQIQKFIQELSKQDATIDEQYVYILLQASSFGGKQIWRNGNKWMNTSFRDYWQPTETSNRRSPVNPMQPNIDVIEDRVKVLANYCKGLKCYNDDIYSILNTDIPDNSIIYIDPPYINTTGYAFNFDITDFINKLTNKCNCPIFVSEYTILSDTYVEMSMNGAKGGISGVRKDKPKEILNIFNCNTSGNTIQSYEQCSLF